MFVGQLFSSYCEFTTTLKEYENENFVCFYKRDSKRIDSNYPNQDLEFVKLKFNCIRGGPMRNQGKGIRKTSSFKIDCPAYISLKATTDGKSLEIKSLNESHNHEISEELFRHLPQQRKLDPEVRKKAMELLDLDVNKKLLQQKLQRETGKVVTLRDLKNLAAQNKRSNDLQEDVTFLQGKDGEISEDMKLHCQDGLPYFHFGKRIYTCHQGKDKNLGQKQKYGEKKQETLGNPTKSKKQAVSSKIKSKLKINEDVAEEEVFWFTLPSVEAHKNHMQGSYLKQEDMKIIRKALDSEEHSGLSDYNSVNRWVYLCSQMEESPVLYYKQENNEILLCIMTEFQKRILLSSDKHILCLDNAYRETGHRFQLTCLMALDDGQTAFPVAFCISNKVDKDVMKQFLGSVRESTGPLSCSYFMSDSENFYREAWQDVMGGDSKWLWCMWNVDSRFRTQMTNLKGQLTQRADYYKKLRLILECQDKNTFETLFENFTNELYTDPLMKQGLELVLDNYAKTKELWAYCYHEDVEMTSVAQFDALHRTMSFCCKEGRKVRLYKFISVIMKLVKYKMLDRLTNMLDNETSTLAVETINAHHKAGFEIPSDSISSMGDAMWLLKSDNDEGNIYVNRDLKSCPNPCSLKCYECDICVHMFSCSCIQNMIHGDLCRHIHAVALKFLTPHFSPLNSPAYGNDMEMDDNSADEFATLNQPSGLVDKILKKTHDVYKQIRSNRSQLSERSLNDIRYYLDRCLDVSSAR